MGIQTDIVGRVALGRRAVGYVRVSTKEQNEETQVRQLVAQGVPRERIPLFFVGSRLQRRTTQLIPKY